MGTNASTPTSALLRAPAHRLGRLTLTALLLAGVAACGSDGGNGVTDPPVSSGTLRVAVETSGFMKDDAYELFVNGVNYGVVGANDEKTIPGLAPASYEVGLTNIASNCTGDPGSVSVVADQTVSITLTVACGYTESAPYTLRASRDRPDLETGSVVECSFGICPSGSDWDLWVDFDSSQDPQAVIRQDQTDGVQIAHVEGVTLATLTEDDVINAAFTTELMPESFDAGRIVLLRTQEGNVYALANPEENDLLVTLAFDAALLIRGGS